MVALKRGRYSKFIRPISMFFDISVLVFLMFYFFFTIIINFKLLFSIGISWILIAYFTAFYDVYRYTTPVEILSKIIKQFSVFIVTVLALFFVFRLSDFNFKTLFWFFLISFISVIIFKTLIFYYLKKYRIIFKQNFRKTIIIGYNEQALNLKKIFETRNDYGYVFCGFFSNKVKNNEILGDFLEAQKFVLKNKIDDIYCSLSDLSNHSMKEIVEFAEINRVTLKFIPDNFQIFTKNLRKDYFELFPVLSLKSSQLYDPVVIFFKRTFDFLFALSVILFILSWLMPVIAIIIKLESRGPVFFKQGRPGKDEKEFFCYKFRSMKLNNDSESEVSKNDPRVTKVGRFIRKTSIDELPQFFNVLFGEMSVVGPRPHLWNQNKAYSSKIKKYMTRLDVKPGVTGLAQVKGFRGEIETDEDMINRIKYDVFYIENWSFFLDIKIIILTIINIFKGQDKAY
jgi:putative colanic acid biosysnthesis UDP-glucose lipid carrier transferase